MTASERMRDDIRKGVDTAKEVADVVRQQPLVQGVENLGRGLVDKARGYTADKLESIFPLNTGMQRNKPPAAAATTGMDDATKKYLSDATVREAAMQKAAQMTEDQQQQRNIAMALMLSGAKALSGKSPYAMQNLGEGFGEGLKGFMGLETTQAAAATKAKESELNRAEKRFANLIKLKAAQIKQRMPELTDPEDREARAIYEVLATMSPKELAAQGLTMRDVLAAKAALSAPKTGTPQATPGFKFEKTS
jgi:hypothetical protein